MSLIGKVEAACSRGELSEAISLAVEEWKKTRASAIANAIDRLDAELKKAPPPKFRTNKAFLEAWLAAAKAGEPSTIAWLGETLRTRLDRNDDEVFVCRLRAMEDAPDPRLARALMTIVEDGLDIARWCDRQIQQTLMAIGDERVREALEKYVAQLEDVDAPPWQDALDQWPATVRLAPAERARWDALGAALVPTAVVVSGDDEDRAVLADALQERGDPRGELIALQIAEAEGKGTAASVRRADELLAKHGKEWLGLLAPIVYRARFRRGVPDILELEPKWKGSAKAWEEHARSPVLATVTRLIEGKTAPDVMATFVGSPAMAALREVTIHGNAVADALDRHAPPALRHVESRLWKRGTYEKRFQDRVIPLLERLTTVTSVECMQTAYDTLASSKVFERIRSLAVRVERDRWPERAKRVAKLPAHVRDLSVFLYDHEEALALLDALPTSVRSYRMNEQAVFSIEDGALTLHLQVVRKGDLDPARSYPGHLELLKLLRKVNALQRIEVRAHVDHVPRDAFDGWKGVEVVFERVYESGLTRGFSHDGTTYW